MVSSIPGVCVSVCSYWMLRCLMITCASFSSLTRSKHSAALEAYVVSIVLYSELCFVSAIFSVINRRRCLSALLAL